MARFRAEYEYSSWLMAADEVLRMQPLRQDAEEHQDFVRGLKALTDAMGLTVSEILPEAISQNAMGPNPVPPLKLLGINSNVGSGEISLVYGDTCSRALIP